MGTNAHNVDIRKLPGNLPPQSQYQLQGSGPTYYIWQSRLNNHHTLIEYSYSNQNSSTLHQHIQTYIWQHNSNLLVSSLYFRSDEEKDKYSIFYERVFTNLSRIKDLCFQDCLQFYYVALNGFKLLWERFTAFEVRQDMFHITSQGKIKVWCDRNISRLYPSQLSGTQQSMVHQIIKIIDQNTDYSKAPVRIGMILTREAASTFELAIDRFIRICRQNGLTITGQLQCLYTIYKGGVQNIVDEYGCGNGNNRADFGEVKKSEKNKFISQNNYDKTKVLTPESKATTVGQLGYRNNAMQLQQQRQSRLQVNNMVFQIKNQVPVKLQAHPTILSLHPHPTSSMPIQIINPNQMLQSQNKMQVKKQQNNKIVEQPQRSLSAQHSIVRQRSSSKKQIVRFNQAPLHSRVGPPIAGCMLTPIRNRSVEVRQHLQNTPLFMPVNSSNANLLNRFGTNAIQPTRPNKVYNQSVANNNGSSVSGVTVHRQQLVNKGIGQQKVLQQRSMRRQIEYKIKQQASSTSLYISQNKPNTRIPSNISPKNQSIKLAQSKIMAKKDQHKRIPLASSKNKNNYISSPFPNQTNTNTSNSNNDKPISQIVNNYKKNVSITYDQNKNHDVIVWDSSIQHHQGQDDYNRANFGYWQPSGGGKGGIQQHNLVHASNIKQSGENHTNPSKKQGIVQNNSYQSLLEKLKAKYSHITYNNDKVPQFQLKSSQTHSNYKNRPESQPSLITNTNKNKTNTNKNQNQKRNGKQYIGSILDKITEGESKHEPELTRAESSGDSQFYHIKVSNPIVKVSQGQDKVEDKLRPEVTVIGEKKYSPKIDDDIWKDMLCLQEGKQRR